jgi:hypothetical protein
MGARTAAESRRIGVICVEKGLITDDELVAALAEQARSGGVLGEILVRQSALTRMQLADALGEQWNGDATVSEPVPEPSADELRELLDEAKAARTSLTCLSNELAKRLAVLEELVAGVNERLGELQAAAPEGGGEPVRKPTVERRKTTRRRTTAA